jgi:hypothetical protein
MMGQVARDIGGVGGHGFQAHANPPLRKAAMDKGARRGAPTLG